jgi:hypothetical protein
VSFVLYVVSLASNVLYSHAVAVVDSLQPLLDGLAKVTGLTFVVTLAGIMTDASGHREQMRTVK